MSQATVETVRAAFAAWNAGDIDALGELYAADAVTSGLDNWPEAGPNVGRDAVIRQYEQVRDAWDTKGVEILGDPVDAGDRVAVKVILHGTGRGPEVKMEMSAIFTVRDREIHRVEFFWDHAKAMAAMGLAERRA